MLNWKEYESVDPIETYGVVVIICVSIGVFFGGRPRFLRGRTLGRGVDRLKVTVRTKLLPLWKERTYVYSDIVVHLMWMRW